MIDKEEILNLYFIEKYKQTEIVQVTGISKSTVNRIIMLDERYSEEKVRRQNANKLKNRNETINYINKVRKSKSKDTVYENLKKQHMEASRELSGGRKPISNRVFRDWNTSIYKYNEKNKCYVLKKGIIVGADVPKRISWKNF